MRKSPNRQSDHSKLHDLPISRSVKEENFFRAFMMKILVYIVLIFNVNSTFFLHSFIFDKMSKYVDSIIFVFGFSVVVLCFPSIHIIIFLVFVTGWQGGKMVAKRRKIHFLNAFRVRAHNTIVYLFCELRRGNMSWRVESSSARPRSGLCAYGRDTNNKNTKNVAFCCVLYTLYRVFAYSPSSNLTSYSSFQ